jgi:hypothetical protein
MMFVFKQDPNEFWEREKPVRVHRANKSPNHGVRAFEQVAEFPTMVEAKAWAAKQEKVDG